MTHVHSPFQTILRWWRWTKAGTGLGSFSWTDTSHATLRQTQRAMASLGLLRLLKAVTGQVSVRSDIRIKSEYWDVQWLLWLCRSRIIFAFPSKSFLKRTKHLWEGRRDVMNKPLLSFLWEIGISSDVEICFATNIERCKLPQPPTWL